MIAVDPEQTGMPWAPPEVPFVEGLPFDHGQRAAIQKRLLDDGKHPLTGGRVLRLEPRNAFSPAVSTCGDCAHLVRRGGGSQYGRVGYPKCELNETSDVRSDVTLKWPSCERFQRRA